jgi:hypothetical protein
MSRLPAKSEILSVFSMILFLVYSYAIYRMVWYVPSWLGYLNLSDILIIGAYSFVMGMFEILIVLLLLLVIAFILPAKFFRLNFAAQSFIVLCVSAFCALIAHNRLFQYVSMWNFTQFSLFVLVALVIAITVIAISYVTVARLKVLRNLIYVISERMTVLLFIYLPIFGIALLFVIVRNFL